MNKKCICNTGDQQKRTIKQYDENGNCGLILVCAIACLIIIIAVACIASRNNDDSRNTSPSEYDSFPKDYERPKDHYDLSPEDKETIRKIYEETK